MRPTVLSGVFLRDILYIDEANKDRRPDSGINLPKFLLIGDLITMIQSFQYRSYTTEKNPVVLAAIFGPALMNEEVSFYTKKTF